MKTFVFGRRGRKRCRCIKPQCKISYKMDKINTKYSSNMKIKYFFLYFIINLIATKNFVQNVFNILMAEVGCRQFKENNLRF